MKTDYESLSQKLKFKRACKTALMILILCIVVIAPAIWCWDQSIQKRQTLREAKNVVLNTELLAMEYYGFNNPIVDSDRASGMSKQAEDEVRNFAGVDGEIFLVSWNERRNRITTMNYQRGRYLVQYRYKESDDSATWDIYWNIQQYDN